jgi:Arc/MetJ-type ribon-helix-helix transcriptional regulator
MCAEHACEEQCTSTRERASELASSGVRLVGDLGRMVASADMMSSARESASGLLSSASEMSESRTGGREVPTQLACADTREHASELVRSGVRLVEKRRTRRTDTTRVRQHKRACQQVSWREMASGLLKSGGREVRRHEKEGRRVGELARSGVREVGDWGRAVTSVERRGATCGRAGASHVPRQPRRPSLTVFTGPSLVGKLYTIEGKTSGSSFSDYLRCSAT